MPSPTSTGEPRSRFNSRFGLTIGMTLVLSTLLAGCWHSDSDNDDDNGGAPPITVSVTPANPSVQTGNTQQFTATVANTANTAVTWQVNNVTGGAAATGTISNTGLYTAPAAVPNPATVTVKAISVADTSVTASVTVTITAPPPPPAVSVDLQPPTASVQVGLTQQFTATVTNAANTAVTWSLSGAGCAGAACGTIDGNGLYTAPASVPNPATVTVTATSVQDPTKSDTAVVTVVAAPPIDMLALLNGRYVLTTMDQERNGFVTGILDFNGAGQVTGGTVDLNVPEATAQTTISGGTYAIGNDGRGRLTVTVTGVGTVHFSIAVVNSDLARIIYFEPTSTGDLFGTLEKQTATATPTGRYVFRLEGTGLTGRRGYVGVLDFGTSTSALDFTEPNPNGYANGYGTLQVFSTAITLGAANAQGRGTLSIDGAQTGNMQFAYWVINAGRLAIIPLDPVAPIINGTAGARPASGGVADRQGAIAAAGPLAAGNYVYTAMGFDSIGVFARGARIASTGGASSPSVSDQVGDTEGQLLGFASTCATTLEASGRSDMFCIPGGYGVRVFFIDGDHGHALVYGGAGFGVGELYRQSAAAYTTADVAGDYSLIEFGDEFANNSTGAINVALAGGLSGTQDKSEDGVQAPDVAFTGSYVLNANGTADTTITTGAITNQHRVWIVSPARIIGFTVNDATRESLILDRQDFAGP